MQTRHRGSAEAFEKAMTFTIRQAKGAGGHLGGRGLLTFHRWYWKSTEGRQSSSDGFA